jgi:3-oxoadipate CoA-transferase alpha subunit
MKSFVIDPDEAVARICDGAVVLVGGFGLAGQPLDLLSALARRGSSELTIVSNNAGNGDEGLARLIKQGQVRKVICSFPRQRDSWHFDSAFRKGLVDLELVPQGTLAERLRAGGAGIGGFFTQTSYGTPLSEGKETRIINGRGYVFEQPIVGHFALIKAQAADEAGNLTYRKTARNFGPVMATAATTTIAEVRSLRPLGELDPECVVTPGIYVDIVLAPNRRSSGDRDG